MKKILIISEIDILYSEKNKIHWLLEGLKEAGLPFHVLCLRDTSKKTQKHSATQWPVTYINTEKENPAFVDAFPHYFFKRIKKELSKESYAVLFMYNTLRFGHYIAQKVHIPYIYDLSDDIAHMAGSSAHLPSWIASIVEQIAGYYVRKNIYHAAKVTVTTPLLFNKFSHQEDKILLLPNGYSWKKDTIHTSLVKPPHEKWIVFVGALREWVNLEEVIEDLSSWPKEYRLVIIGTEGKLDFLQQLSKTLGVYERIYWLGHIPHQQLPAYLSLCNIGIIPFTINATTVYSFPLKLVEYLSLHLKVISTPLPFVQKQFGAYITVKKDQMSWGTAIKQSLEYNPTIPEEFIVQYSWHTIQKQFITLLSSYLETSSDEAPFLSHMH